jgi:hypothetical protein
MTDADQARNRGRETLEIRTYRLAIVAATASVLAVIVAVLAWLYPNEPAPTVNDRNFVYKAGAQIGHVQLFRLDPVLMGQFALRIDQADKLQLADVIEFHDTHCVIVTLEGEHSTLSAGRSIFTYEHIDCRIIGR